MTSTARRPVGAPHRGQAANDEAPLDARQEQERQAAERERLAGRIVELRRQIAAGEKTKSGASATLARAERALADIDARLDAIGERRRATEALVTTLDSQRAATDRQIASGETDVARAIVALSANAARDPWVVYLTGGDPNEPGRNAADLLTVTRAALADADEWRGRASELRTRRERADEEERALADEVERQTAAREALARTEASHRETLASLTRQLAVQRHTADSLEADERRLTAVVQRLQRVIERRAADERARRDAERRVAEQRAAAAARQQARNDRTASSRPDGSSGNMRDATPRTSPPVSSPMPPREPIDAGDPGGSAFAQLRGQMRLPVRGSTAGRFGGPRGAGGATWKGLFVRTEPDAEVRAVADGRVIFADDLRGFGNLVIVDHGGQYLSIYGNNATLAKRTGDPVRAGEVVSRAGNSSGDDETGLYFELRYRGRPFDPTPWIGGR